MDSDEQLRILQAAQGQPAMLALAMVDLTYPTVPEGERAALKTALEAAAVPHWCDEKILSVLLGIAAEESAGQFARLGGLSVVEPFPARGATAANVHEASRLALRRRLSADEPARFRLLAGRAAGYFESDLSQSGRIEGIYHLLCSEPGRGADGLAEMSREWYRTARPEDRDALVTALKELETTRLVQGRARVWALLVMSWTRFLRGEAAQLSDLAEDIIAQAKSLADQRAESDAHALLGEALQAQGSLPEATAEFEAGQKICQSLALRDPGNTGLQLELAVTHGQVGLALQAQDKLEEAQKAFEAALEINQRLAQRDPENAAWQRDLAVSHSHMGWLLEARDNSTEALAEFEASVKIFQRLSEQVPDNAEWQLGLAAGYLQKGGSLEKQGRLSEAQSAFEQALVIDRGLGERDPSNLAWQGELAVAHNRLGGVLEKQKNLTGALVEFEAAVEITDRLAKQDPASGDRWRELAVAHNRKGGILEAQGQLTEALSAFESALAIHQRLVEREPGNGAWQRDLATAYSRVGGVLQAQGKPAEAKVAWDAAAAIDRRQAEAKQAQ